MEPNNVAVDASLMNEVARYPRPGSRTASFFLALFLVCASTLMYEVVLTRLLSVVSWYYLAFVSVSMAMFGMTAGALMVHLRPDLFSDAQIPQRLVQVSMAMAISLPISLLTMLAVPVDISLSLQTVYSFLLFTSVISVPFFFSGIAICVSLTKTPYPIGIVYCVDLTGAALGCLGAVGLLRYLNGPSAVFAISAMVFVAAGAYAVHAGERRPWKKFLVFAFSLLTIAILNSLTLHGIEPIWSKGVIDRRTDLLAEIWNPISKVRAFKPSLGLESPTMWGPSPRMPAAQKIDVIGIDIDNDAYTPMFRWEGDPNQLNFLNYDVTSIAYQIRKGGTAAVIGPGGGRDVLTAVANRFRRIVGIEVNSAITNLATRRLNWFSRLGTTPEIHIYTDEGRSFLTRSGEKFDVIQASMVDTWAAASAGAMTLSENSLYTVDGWHIFYQHLKPGGLISFTRWNSYANTYQTYRLFSLAWATLLTEGVANPGLHMALVGSGEPSVATLLVSNQPLAPEDIRQLRTICDSMDFRILFLPGQSPATPELARIASVHTVAELMHVHEGAFDYSPVFDSSPFFFNALRLRNLSTIRNLRGGGNLLAILVVLCFMLVASILLCVAILLPLIRWGGMHESSKLQIAGGIAYFVSIGLGFMFVEIAMMQQLSILLGHPIYSLVIVLAGLIFSTGLGSLVSERLRLGAFRGRIPALLAALVIGVYSTLVVTLIHRYAGEVLWQRVILCLGLIMPCGFLMGFCFPVGLRWMVHLRMRDSLPWMWALNGAASVLASFVAVLVSMESSITVCALTGAACYVLAVFVFPWPAARAQPSLSTMLSEPPSLSRIA